MKPQHTGYGQELAKQKRSDLNRCHPTSIQRLQTNAIVAVVSFTIGFAAAVVFIYSIGGK